MPEKNCYLVKSNEALEYSSDKVSGSRGCTAVTPVTTIDRCPEMTRVLVEITPGTTAATTMGSDTGDRFEFASTSTESTEFTATFTSPTEETITPK